ncbi:hypothetical protein LJE06_13050 [Bilophila wadsworthia]|nr:hypothetical protein [Bilophila wadsworthia]
MLMFAEKTLEILKRYVAERHEGRVLRASTELGVPNDTFDKWLKGQRDPGLFKLGPVMDKILQGYARPENIEALNVSFPMIVQGKEESSLQKRVEELEKQLEDAVAEKNRLLGKIDVYKDLLGIHGEDVLQKEPQIKSCG